MFYQILLSPQVKQCAIITYKLGIYNHESPATSARHRDQAPTTAEHGNKQPRRTPPPRSTIEQNTNADISTEQPEDPSNPPAAVSPAQSAQYKETRSSKTTGAQPQVMNIYPRSNIYLKTPVGC